MLSSRFSVPIASTSAVYLRAKGPHLSPKHLQTRCAPRHTHLGMTKDTATWLCAARLYTSSGLVSRSSIARAPASLISPVRTQRGSASTAPRQLAGRHT